MKTPHFCAAFSALHLSSTHFALGVGISQASEALSQFPEAFTMVFGQSPVVIATIMAVLLNLILPKEK